MGNSVSSNATSSVPAPTAKLILMDGSIQEFFEEKRSQEILQEYPSHCICNSDGFYVGRKISQVLRDDDRLQIGQLYFLLSKRKLEFVLTDSDMASLLSKMNSAWQLAQKKKRQSRRFSCGFGKAQTQVQPMFDIHNQHEFTEEEYSSPTIYHMSKRPNLPISNPKGRGRIQWQSKLDTIAETV